MPPVVSFVGTGKVGKTTFLEKLIPELVRLGYRVASIKHTVHKTTLDQPEKDTARHLKAGSSVIAISSPNEFVIIRKAESEATLEDMVRLIGDDSDILLTEGFKQGSAPKIEVHRKEKGEALGKSLKNLVGVVTDEPLDMKVPQFSLDDYKGVADFLEKRFIKPNRTRLTIYVNGKRVPLSDFPQEFIGNTLTGMVSSLKGIGKIKRIDISLRR